MKFVVLGDTHWGARNDSASFQDYFEVFYNETMFPYMEKHGLTYILQLGDLFDRRKFISFNTLKRTRKTFFDKIEEKGFWLDVIIGNHDIPFRNTLSVNSPELLLGEYSNIRVWKEPTTHELDGLKVDFIPWICRENEQSIIDFIKNSDSRICFGHFELSGFEMDRGNVCQIDSSETVTRNFLQKYEKVYSGHFHHRSTDGHIFYVGSPAQMTWADVDDVRGFHVFDTNTLDTTFVPNPVSMFHKIIYNDTEPMDSNLECYKDTYVKVIVAQKTKPHEYEKFIENLHEVNPIDITVSEDVSTETETEDTEFDGEQDTPTLLKKYLDGIEFDGDKNLLYNKMHELYVEAQSLEK